MYLMWLLYDSIQCILCCYWCDYTMSQCYMYLMLLWCRSTVCIWCGYDVVAVHLFDVVIRCHTAVCFWCGYTMSQCCMWSMWLCDAIVPYVFDVVIWCQGACGHTMSQCCIVWIWCGYVICSVVCILRGDDIIVLYVFYVVMIW